MAILSIGILFNAIVSGLVFASALSLSIFLWRRSANLDEAMQAYKWLWLSTALTWGSLSVRYFIISLGQVNDYIQILDIITQAGVFLSGPCLFYYLGFRVLRSRRLALITAWSSFALAIVSIYLILRPDGLPIMEVTIFSADATINKLSFAIFSVQSSAILLMLTYDISWRLRDWWRRGIPNQMYQAAYSAAIILYLALGSIDESKVLTDWPLIVFRMLYAAGFLMVYLAITQDENNREQNLIRSSGLSSPYGNTAGH